MPPTGHRGKLVLSPQQGNRWGCGKGVRGGRKGVDCQLPLILSAVPGKPAHVLEWKALLTSGKIMGPYSRISPSLPLLCCGELSWTSGIQEGSSEAFLEARRECRPNFLEDLVHAIWLPSEGACRIQEHYINTLGGDLDMEDSCFKKI
ncbi:uncharacterized protein LOC107159587 [Marmota marmota marmota]|uniref:uncharacterized protein LOC107159587 n=1 Tax=Marmota marmota marmota TaxID=9994 RepID=UPI002093481C|nr:uncharacterized protein LOC107159587 [Marmota marmota marmota]